MAAATPSRPTVCVVPSNDVLLLAEELQGLGGDDIAVAKCTFLESFEKDSVEKVADWLRKGLNASLPVDSSMEGELPSFLENIAQYITHNGSNDQHGSNNIMIGVSWICIENDRVKDGLGRPMSPTQDIRGAVAMTALQPADVHFLVSLALADSQRDRIVLLQIFNPDTTTISALSVIISSGDDKKGGDSFMRMHDLLLEIGELHHGQVAGEHYLRSAQLSSLNRIAAPLLAGNARLFMPLRYIHGYDNMDSSKPLCDLLAAIKAVCTKVQIPGLGLDWISKEKFLELQSNGAEKELENFCNTKNSHLIHGSDPSSLDSHHDSTLMDGNNLDEVPIVDLPDKVRKRSGDIPDGGRSNTTSFHKKSNEHSGDSINRKSREVEIALQSKNKSLRDEKLPLHPTSDGIMPRKLSYKNENVMSNSYVALGSPELKSCERTSYVGRYTQKAKAKDQLGNTINTDSKSPLTEAKYNRMPINESSNISGDIFSMIPDLSVQKSDDHVHGLLNPIRSFEGRSPPKKNREQVIDLYKGCASDVKSNFDSNVLQRDEISVETGVHERSIPTLGTHVTDPRVASRISQIGICDKDCGKEVDRKTSKSEKGDDITQTKCNRQDSQLDAVIAQLKEEQHVNEICIRQWQDAEQRAAAAEALIMKINHDSLPLDSEVQSCNEQKKESSGLFLALKRERRRVLELEQQILEEREMRIQAEIRMISAQKEASISLSRCRALSHCLERGQISIDVFASCENALLSAQKEVERLNKENRRLASNLGTMEVSALISQQNGKDDTNSAEIIAELQKKLESRDKEMKKIQNSLSSREEELLTAERKLRGLEMHRRIAQIATHRVSQLQEKLKEASIQLHHSSLVTAEAQGAVESLESEKLELIAALEASEQPCIALNEVNQAKEEPERTD